MTLTTEALRPHTTNGTPPAASGRAYLRAGLPAPYRDQVRSARDRPGEPFAMRFVGALEEVLDPIVALLDLLPAHLHVAIAPRDFIAMLGEWLGLELDAGLESNPARLLGAHRRLVGDATEITRDRGTRAGVESLLKLAFENVALEVQDSGGVTWSTDSRRLQPAADPLLTILHPPELAPRLVDVLRRVADDVRPAGVGLELRAEEERT